jgi:Inorganic Pyrophosphatase
MACRFFFSGKEIPADKLKDFLRSVPLEHAQKAVPDITKNSYNSISWTPGEQQAERYDLSKHIHNLRYIKNPNGTYDLGANSNPETWTEHHLGSNIPENKLADYVGKDVADRIVNGVGEDNPHGGKILSGLDLKVGGEGMKGFYDQMLVNKANAIGKKFGTQVEWKELPIKKPLNVTVQRSGGTGWTIFTNGQRTGHIGGELTQEQALQVARQSAESNFVARSSKRGQETIKVPVLRLTPKLKEQALRGMPLFSAAGTAAAPLAAQNRRHGGRINPNPSEAQIKAGNYQKRHTSFAGLDISIENEKGSIRRGKKGKPWEVIMPAAYGYLKNTEGADGDHVDAYLGPHTRSAKAFVIDQIDADSKHFDEHKVGLGFGSKAQFLAVYKKAFSDGKGGQRIGAIHEMTIPEFKDWLKRGDTTRPIRKITREAFQYHTTRNLKERCATCQYTSGTDNGCGLYRMLNQRMPEDFDLDPDIQPDGWCSAFTPRRRPQ